MAFHFVNFLLETAGDGIPLIPEILVYVQPADRYTKLKNINSSVLVSLAGPSLQSSPVDYDGFIIQRSSDNITFADVSGVVRDSFFYIDAPPTFGIYYYRARTRVASGAESAHGNTVVVAVEDWQDADDLAVYDMRVDGVVIDRLDKTLVFPNGLGGDTHTGMNISEGSLGGGFGGGSWYVGTKEVSPPQIINNVPVCGTINNVLPLTVLTFTIRDFPYPSGGSGINDASYLIRLSVGSEFGGAFLTVRNGASQPFSAAIPLISCVIVPGANPLLERDVTITVPAGYIKTDDVVQVSTYVKDVDGNTLSDLCSFTMEHVDIVPPVVSNQDPECGTGIDPSDDRRVKRDFSYLFKVSDLDSGVDLSSLNVFHGPSSTGPWTQVLSGGSTFLLGFTGSVTSDGSTGFDVTINRSASSPLWDADSIVCFRVDVQDVSGNTTQDICCFKTEPCVRISSVTPLAEGILFVQFSGPVTDGEALRSVDSYTITPSNGGSLISIRSIAPEKFTLPSDDEQLLFRLGVGYPTFVLIDTTTHDFWGEYVLDVENLTDKYGLPFCANGTSFSYRGRRTKVDEGINNMKDSALLGRDSVSRRILSGILRSDEEIGGVFLPDDWESK